MSNYSAARSTLEEAAGEAAKTAANTMRDKFAQANDAVKEGAERVQAEAGAAVKNVSARVSERPLAAVAATLAIGALAGYLLGRRQGRLYLSQVAINRAMHVARLDELNGTKVGRPRSSRVSTFEKERRMNQDQIAGNWKQLKGKVKEQWGKLTDDDITQLEGHQDQLVGKIQERYGVAKEDAEKQIESFRAANKDLWWN